MNVPDDRFNWLVQHHKPKSVIPAFLEVPRRRPRERRLSPPPAACLRCFAVPDAL